MSSPARRQRLAELAVDLYKDKLAADEPKPAAAPTRQLHPYLFVPAPARQPEPRSRMSTHSVALRLLLLLIVGLLLEHCLRLAWAAHLLSKYDTYGNPWMFTFPQSWLQRLAVSAARGFAEWSQQL